MKNSKAIRSTILLIFLVLGFTGCTKENDKEEVNTENTVNPSATVAITQSIDTNIPATELPKQKEDNIVIPAVTIGIYEIPDNEALKFVNDMKIGWNLGNTFDAAFDNPSFTDDLKFETSWCGVKTTKEMILKLKDAGFRTIRISVSWHNHLLDENFTINEPWLNRVQEVVDYVIEEDMYVILNIHHDISEEYYYPSMECLENSSKYMVSIWSQIADKFSDYNNNLIFESINEPRLVGTENEWWLDRNKESCMEAVECINELNQIFVDTVRSSGGNNEGRYLMVPGYSASPENAFMDEFKVPDDLEGNINKIIISVHAYTPYNFALQGLNENGSITDFNASEKKSQKDIDYFLENMYQKYISQGTAVVIGEFGARNKEDNLQDRVDFAAYYIAAAKARGIICCWWDNNSFTGSGENFGLLDRKTVTIKYPDIVDAMMRYAE